MSEETVNAYLATLARMEQDIALVDRDAALVSIAISMKRIADSLETLKVIATESEVDLSLSR
jgi:hypothetical protein